MSKLSLWPMTKTTVPSLQLVLSVHEGMHRKKNIHFMSGVQQWSTKNQTRIGNYIKQQSDWCDLY